METLREEVNAKLKHILHDIKNLQKTIIIDSSVICCWYLPKCVYSFRLWC
jgi:hypothetical protein